MRGMFHTAAGVDVPINPPFELDNRGKRSVVLNLASEDGRAIADAL
jgi:crotonobetainyl-CoA:carnitine CoA-transferase CaiB-like acyl-CoA transferase